MTILNLEIPQGATYSANIALLDGNNQPINVAGYSANASLKLYPAANTATSFAVSLSNGNLTISMDANTTASLGANVYFYDVLVSNGSFKTRVQEGFAVVTPQISQL